MDSMIGAINNRVSIRSYADQPIEPNEKQELIKLLQSTREGPFGNEVRFTLIDLSEMERNEIKGLGGGVRWKKWTPKSDRIKRRRCQIERGSARKIHEGVSRGSRETGNRREDIVTGSSPEVVIAAIDTWKLGQGL